MGDLLNKEEGEELETEDRSPITELPQDDPEDIEDYPYYRESFYRAGDD